MVLATSSGEAFLRTANRILDETARLEVDLDRLAYPRSNSLAIGALPVAAAGLLPDLIARLWIAQPNLEVSIVHDHAENLLAQLRSGAIDLIVGRLRDGVGEGIVGKIMYDEPISIMARTGHPLAGFPCVSHDDLLGFPFALLTGYPQLSAEIEDLARQIWAHLPRIDVRSSSIGFIRELIQAGDYLTAAPHLLLAGDILRGTLVTISAPEPASCRPGGVAYLKERRLPPAAEAFIDIMAEHFEGSPSAACRVLASLRQPSDSQTASSLREFLWSHAPQYS